MVLLIFITKTLPNGGNITTTAIGLITSDNASAWGFVHATALGDYLCGF